jgi:hypothetical protein
MNKEDMYVCPKCLREGVMFNKRQGAGQCDFCLAEQKAKASKRSKKKKRELERKKIFKEKVQLPLKELGESLRTAKTKAKRTYRNFFHHPKPGDTFSPYFSIKKYNEIYEVFVKELELNLKEQEVMEMLDIEGNAETLKHLIEKY